jgi:hypothetical protein
MDQQIIGLKELREKVAHFAREVQRGKTFIVVKQSKPLFKISQPILEAGDLEAVDGKGWQSLVDFTQIRKGGVPASDVLKVLKRLNGQDRKKSKKA